MKKSDLWEASDHTKETKPKAWAVLCSDNDELSQPGEALIGVAFRDIDDALALVRDQLDSIEMGDREQEAIDALAYGDDEEHRIWEDGNGLLIEIRLISIV